MSGRKKGAECMQHATCRKYPKWHAKYGPMNRSLMLTPKELDPRFCNRKRVWFPKPSIRPLFQKGSQKTSNSGATAMAEKHPHSTPLLQIPFQSFCSIIAILIWLGPMHFNTVMALLVLLNLRSPWAYGIIAFYVLLAFLPADYSDPWGVWIAKFVSKHAPKYFPMVVNFEDRNALTSDRAFVFALEPHSIMPIGVLSLSYYAGFLPFSNGRVLVSSAALATPILRHIWTWMGSVPASRKVFTQLLNDGYSCGIVPGGVQEIFYMESGHEVVFLKQRYGFVRVAIETGAPLVPVFCFGQTDVYSWWKPRGKFYLWVSRAIKFTPLIFWGRYGSPVPYRRPLYIAVGSPIEVTKNPQPTKDEVAAVHSKFIQAIEELYHKHKAAAGFKDTILHVY